MLRAPHASTDADHIGLVVLLLCCAAALLFTRLDDIYLWQDEAETAVLARNVLQFGYPRAFDGTHQLYVPFADHRPGYVWIFHPWMQFYLTAASFALFGITTWAARFPFALLGLGSIGLTWLLAQRLFRDRQMSLLATFLLTTSVPFALHMRQCRYYAPTVFLTLLTMLAYWRWLQQRRGGGVLWFLGLLVLFHTNWAASAAVGLACAGHWWCNGGRRHIVWSAAVGWSVVFLVCAVPWLVYARAWEHGAGEQRTFEQMRHNVEFYVKMINSHLLPMGVALMAVLVQAVRRQLRTAHTDDRRALGMLAWTIGATLLVLMPARQHFFRYLIGIVPLLYLLMAWMLVRWYGRRPWLLAAIASLLILTNVLHRPDDALAGAPRFPLVDYVGEITHRYEGTTEGIVTFLNAHTQPGDTVKTRYASTPLVFYTQLQVDTEAYAFYKDTRPDWIVHQRDWVKGAIDRTPENPALAADYERIETTIPDSVWGNPPAPYLHMYRTPKHLPGVVFYRKRTP